MGYKVEDFRAYFRDPDSDKLQAECQRQLLTIPIEEATTGDILTFFFTDSKRPYHFAIMTSPKHMIHAYADERKVVEASIDNYWKERISFAYRYPGLIT